MRNPIPRRTPRKKVVSDPRPASPRNYTPYPQSSERETARTTSRSSANPSNWLDFTEFSEQDQIASGSSQRYFTSPLSSPPPDEQFLNERSLFESAPETPVITREPTPVIIRENTPDFELERLFTTMPPKVKTSIPEYEVSEEALRATQNDKLPKIYKKAPQFSKEDPELLEQFLAECEDIFEANSITIDEAKILLAMKYMDSKTRTFHRDDAKNAGESWETFKSLLRKQYPESVGDIRGSIGRLNELVIKFAPIMLGQREKLLKFVREFKVEYNKLDKEPKIISNQQAVSWFARALDISLKNAMVPYLPKIDENARPEDPHTLDVIIEAAKSACNNHFATLTSIGIDDTYGRFARSEASTSTSAEKGKAAVKAEPDEFWQKLSVSTDTHDAKIREIMEKVNQNSIIVTNLAKILMTQANQAQANNNASTSNNSSGNSYNHTYQPRYGAGNGNTWQSRKCYFCGKPDHIITDCPLQHEYFEKGILVKQENGAIRFKDGSLVPKPMDGESETRAQKVAKIVKEKGWDTPSKTALFSSIEENDSAYDEQPVTTETLASFMGQITAVMKSLEDKNKDLEEKYDASEAHRKDELAIIQKSLEQLLLSGN